VPQVKTSPRPASSAAVAYNQNTVFARQSANRIRAYADQILIDISRGHLVRANARQIALDALALCEALAVMAAAEEAAARPRAT
jgi:hypothetical protein